MVKKSAIVGMNDRLDGLQAAVLSVKLRHFDEEMHNKQQVADAYTERLSGYFTVPTVIEGNQP